MNCADILYASIERSVYLCAVCRAYSVNVITHDGVDDRAIDGVFVCFSRILIRATHHSTVTISVRDRCSLFSVPPGEAAIARVERE